MFPGTPFVGSHELQAGHLLCPAVSNLDIVQGAIRDHTVKEAVFPLLRIFAPSGLAVSWVILPTRGRSSAPRRVEMLCQLARIHLIGFQLPLCG